MKDGGGSFIFTCSTKTHIAYGYWMTSNFDIIYKRGGHDMQEGVSFRLIIDFQSPSILITFNPSDILWHNQDIFINLSRKGSSKSIVVPSPGAPIVSSVTLSTMPQRETKSLRMSKCRWYASFVSFWPNTMCISLRLFYKVSMYRL